MAPSPSVFLSAIAQRTQAAALRHLRLCAAGASPAAGAGGNLHARPHERRTAGDRLRPRLGAVRNFLLRAGRRAAAADLCRASRTDPQGLHRQDAELERPIRPVRERADGDRAAAEAASAALVRRAFARQRRARRPQGPAHGQQRHAGADARDHRALPGGLARGATARRALPKMGMVRFIVVADSDERGDGDRAARLSALARELLAICTTCTARRRPRRCTWRASTR